MNRVLTLAVVLALSAGSAMAAPNCTTGVPCGNSCISKDKVCHKTGGSTSSSTSPSSSAMAAKPASTTTASSSSSTKKKSCTTGVACGNSCIPKGKTCNVPG